MKANNPDHTQNLKNRENSNRSLMKQRKQSNECEQKFEIIFLARL